MFRTLKPFLRYGYTKLQRSAFKRSYINSQVSFVNFRMYECFSKLRSFDFALSHYVLIFHKRNTVLKRV